MRIRKVGPEGGASPSGPGTPAPAKTRWSDQFIGAQQKEAQTEAGYSKERATQPGGASVALQNRGNTEEFLEKQKQAKSKLKPGQFTQFTKNGKVMFMYHDPQTKMVRTGVGSAPAYYPGPRQGEDLPTELVPWKQIEE